MVVVVDECTRSGVTDLELFEETLRRAPEVGKAQPLPPGRGTLVAQGRASLVQTILVDDGAPPLGKEDA